MVVIGLDVGTNSIKISHRKEDGEIETAELPTSVLFHPEKGVISSGAPAIKNYLERDETIPYGVTLLEGEEVLKHHLAALLSDPEKNPATDVVAVAIPPTHLRADRVDNPLLRDVKQAFPNAKVVTVDAAICAAAVFKQIFPDTQEMVVCDLGKSALKMALCFFEKDTIQVLQSELKGDLGWNVFEDGLLRCFSKYSELENEFLEALRIQFREEILQILYGSDHDEGFTLLQALEGLDGQTKAADLANKPFINPSESSLSLKVGEVYEQYTKYISGILGAIDIFLNENKGVDATVFITGAGPSLKKFKDLFATSINRRAKYLKSDKVIIASDPKHTISEGARMIAAGECRVKEPIHPNITYKGSRLVNGKIEKEHTLLLPLDLNMSGEKCNVCRVVVLVKPTQPILLSYGEKVVSFSSGIRQGEYDLVLSINRFGKAELTLKRDGDAASVGIINGNFAMTDNIGSG